MIHLGIDPAVIGTSALFGLGDRGLNKTSAGVKEYMYVRANGAITGDGYTAVIDVSSFDATPIDTTVSAPGAGQGAPVGVARGAFADNDYGWVQIYGAGLLRVAASCAAFTIINSTGTAGQLDDDASTGAEVIVGLCLTAARGGSAGTAAASIAYPTVGRTL